MYDFFYKELRRSTDIYYHLNCGSKLLNGETVMNLDELKNILHANSLPEPVFRLDELSNQSPRSHRTICGALITVKLPTKTYRVWEPGYVIFPDKLFVPDKTYVTLHKTF